MLKSKKHVFWEALLIAIVIFGIGFIIGTGYESANIIRVNEFYIQSEIDLADSLAIIQLMDFDFFECEVLEEVTFELADKVYKDAKILERYEDAGVITETMELMHKKFDVLRTFIWINNYKIFENCQPSYNLVVYLYEQETSDLAQRANQNVWSKILTDAKQKHGPEILLIPIAVDQEISSLDLVLSDYEIPRYPALVINNEIVVTRLNNVRNLEEYLFS